MKGANCTGRLNFEFMNLKKIKGTFRIIYIDSGRSRRSPSSNSSLKPTSRHQTTPIQFVEVNSCTNFTMQIVDQVVSAKSHILQKKKYFCRWNKVCSLEKGKIYAGGTIEQLQKLTGWTGHKVMYFGDHPYADLADATLHHGWHTGAVIR